MDGVIVLSVGEYIETFGGAWSVASILLLVSSILIVIMGIITYFGSRPSDCLIGIFALFVGGAIFTCAIREYKNNGSTINIPQYKVIVSDSVSYNKFIEKYNVLKVEDKIYTIIDKAEYETAKTEIKGD